MIDAPTLAAAPLALAQSETKPAQIVRGLAESFAVTTHAEFETAAEVLRTVKGEWKRLDELRKSWTGPLANVTRSINGAFAGPLGALAAAEVDLKAKCAAFSVRMHEARVEAVTVGAGIVSVIPFTPEAPGLAIRTKRSFRVVDPEKVPRSFCSVDETKIRAHLANGGLEAIPGVEFFDEQIVSVRS